MFNRFIKIFKRVKAEEFDCCVHDYQLLEKSSREIDVSRDMNIYTVEDVYIYCPRCRKRKVVTPLEWRLIVKQQKIDADYIKTHKIYVKGG